MENETLVEPDFIFPLKKDVLSLVFEYDAFRKEGCIADPATGAQIMHFPRQDIEVDGYEVHHDSIFSKEFSSYLKYLERYHIVLRPEVTPLIEIYDEEEAVHWYHDSIDDTFIYSVKTIHIPKDVGHLLYHNDSIGFTFIDEKLYSCVSVDVVEKFYANCIGAYKI